MKLLTEYQTVIYVNDSIMYFDQFYTIENLSTYNTIRVNIDDSKMIYYKKPFIKIVDSESNFFKIYTKNKGFKLYDLFYSILDFEIERNKLNEDHSFHGLLWNAEKDGFLIKWKKI